MAPCTRWPRRLSLLGMGMVLGLTSGFRAPSVHAEEPLPTGALVRLGGAPHHFRYGATFTLLGPNYSTIAMAESQGPIRQFDVATGRPLEMLARELKYGGPIVASRDGKRFVQTLPGAPALVVRESSTGKEIQSLKAPKGFTSGYTYGAASVSMSSDGKVLAQAVHTTGANAKGEVIVWDVDNNAELARISTMQRGPTVPYLSPDGTILVTRPAQVTSPTIPRPGGPVEKLEFDPNRTLQVWSVETGKEVFKAPITGTSLQIAGFAFSPGGSLMAASCGDGPIDIWDIAGKTLKTTLLGRTRQGQRLAFSPDGKTLAAVSADGTIQRWSVADRKLLGTTEGPPSLPATIPTPQGLEFADHDRVVAWTALGQFPTVWETPSGKVLTPMPEHFQAIRSIAFAAGGKEIVTAGQDTRLVRWDAATGKPLGELKLRSNRSAPVAYRQFLHLSPDGTRALIMGTPGMVYDLTTGTEMMAIPAAQLPGGYQMQLAPNSNLSKVAALSSTYNPKQSGACIVWDLEEQKKLGEIELPGNGPPGGLSSVAISPSGTRIVMATPTPVAGGGRPNLLITGWDLKTGKKLGEIEDMNLNGAAQIAAASESTAIVMTAGGRMRLYNYEAGKFGDEIEPGSPRGGQTGHIVFCADGKRFAVGISTEDSNLYGVRVYDWPSTKPLHTFTGHRTPVTALAFAPDGKRLASGAQDTSVIVWDLAK